MSEHFSPFARALGWMLPLFLVSSGVGCDEPIEGFAAPGTGGAGGAPTNAATTTSSAGASPSTGGGGEGGAAVPESLPFAVDDFFAPSGFMGDGEATGPLTFDNACTVRAGDETGMCHKIDYTRGDMGWAGVYWQYPDGNWGTSPGLPMPTGDVQVTFWAWSDGGGEVVSFFAGGIGGGATPFSDTFNEAIQVTLTNSPTQYTIGIGALPHDEILGGFGWSADGVSPGAVVFYIDDIQYEASP